MAQTKKEMLIAWLNDAHAMELSLVENLEEKSKDAETAGKPDVKKRIDEHLEETKGHAKQIEECVEELGSKVSTAKDMMGKFSGDLQGKMKSMYDDVMVKNALESYSAEHFEIAAYTSLVAAAKDIGEEKVAQVCAKILEDELRMASWAVDQISAATLEHIATMSEA